MHLRATAPPRAGEKEILGEDSGARKRWRENAMVEVPLSTPATGFEAMPGSIVCEARASASEILREWAMLAPGLGEMSGKAEAQ